jgi:hypothetical protein
MKNKILMFVVSQLLEMLNPEVLKDVVDKLLDYVEEKIEDSETQIDDKLALPLIAMVREAFDIPDDD